MKRKTPTERFFENIEKTPGCWNWTKRWHVVGYGMMSDKKPIHAHRWSYQYFKGPIPEGLVIDHICRNRRCVNPDHLRAVTQRQNTLENSLSPSAINAKKTSCKRGHPFTKQNTFVRKRGSRECKTCMREKAGVKVLRKEDMTHCKWGHEFVGANILIDKKGRRSCAICYKIRVKKYKQKRTLKRQSLSLLKNGVDAIY